MVYCAAMENGETQMSSLSSSLNIQQAAMRPQIGFRDADQCYKIKIRKSDELRFQDPGFNIFNSPFEWTNYRRYDGPRVRHKRHAAKCLKSHLNDIRL